MKIPEMNHHANRIENPVPVQRWQRIANRFKDTGRVYRSLLLMALCVAALDAQQFDVASVKPNRSNDQPYSNMPLGPGAVYTPNGGYFNATNLPLITYIAFAWKISQSEFQYLMPQLPQWIMSDHFNIQARAEGNPGKDTMRLMMRSLLAERFKLALRSEKREIPVSAFVLATPGITGPQLRLHTGGDCPRNNDPTAPPPT